MIRVMRLKDYTNCSRGRSNPRKFRRKGLVKKYISSSKKRTVKYSSKDSKARTGLGSCKRPEKVR